MKFRWSEHYQVYCDRRTYIAKERAKTWSSNQSNCHILCEQMSKVNILKSAKLTKKRYQESSLSDRWLSNADEITVLNDGRNLTLGNLCSSKSSSKYHRKFRSFVYKEIENQWLRGLWHFWVKKTMSSSRLYKNFVKGIDSLKL